MGFVVNIHNLENMNSILIQIYDYNLNKYDKFAVIYEGIVRDKIVCGGGRRRVKINACGICLHFFINKIVQSSTYRQLVFDHLVARNGIGMIKFVLVPTVIDTIDYNWNEKLNYLVREQCEVDHTLSWLSTLGGAFSALGDYFVNMAVTAGKISYHQLQLACRLGDPQVAARCKLYFSLSLIQRHRYKLAQAIIWWEYKRALYVAVRDERLIRMCKGIWAKLQYEHSLFIKKKIKNKTNCIDVK